ncbi:hypothetical protein H6P81_010998 [Aristolochia fimbriata]|uniref:DJ-1/PfpI domain-containing protein n=1 Tax=Aristolochia fimbriata TaxID=158543 RepID=A0AAV7EQM8_ARIFI|nr:hypothetical protein H6P81_010998 [Aristolochia fimbriata]
MVAVASLRPSCCSPLPTRSKSSTATKRAIKPCSISPAVSCSPLKKVLVPIAFGTEEMEAVILVDVLRRAGADVLVASVEKGLEVVASSGTKISADISIAECADEIFDLVALPGGMPGSARLRDCQVLRSITSKQAEGKKLYGAMCAAPAVVLQPWGLLKRKKTTGHPAFMHQLPTFWAVASNIQVSGELTTSRGPGTTMEFALSLTEQLFGKSVSEEIGATLLMHVEDDLPRKEEFNKVDWSFNNIPQVLVPVANGSEEMEVVTIVDILRRAKVDVVIASVEKSLQVVGSQKTKIVADKSIDAASESLYDLIILPGGVNGAECLHCSKTLKRLLKDQMLSGRAYGAMCSSPTVLHSQGLLKDRRVTAHPAVLDKLVDQVAGVAGVVIDGKVITCKGLGTSADFALAIVDKLYGHSRVRSVAEGIVFNHPKT